MTTKEQFLAAAKALHDEGYRLSISESLKQLTKDKPATKPAKSKAASGKNRPSPDEVASLISPKRFGEEYQNWYTKALPFVRQVLPERYAEFAGLYKNEKRKEIDFETYTISDFALGLVISRGGMRLFEPHRAMDAKFRIQLDIVNSAAARLESVLADVRGTIEAQLFDDELDAATDLLKKGHLRAAGALAGVTLERHLQRVALNHNTKIAKKDPTISDLNDPLKSDGVYDQATWRFVQHLADLRNLAAHQKGQDPTKVQMTDLIDGTRKIMKTVY